MAIRLGRAAAAAVGFQVVRLDAVLRRHQPVDLLDIDRPTRQRDVGILGPAASTPLQLPFGLSMNSGPRWRSGWPSSRPAVVDRLP